MQYKERGKKTTDCLNNMTDRFAIKCKKKKKQRGRTSDGEKKSRKTREYVMRVEKVE